MVARRICPIFTRWRTGTWRRYLDLRDRYDNHSQVIVSPGEETLSIQTRRSVLSLLSVSNSWFQLQHQRSQQKINEVFADEIAGMQDDDD